MPHQAATSGGPRATATRTRNRNLPQAGDAPDGNRNVRGERNLQAAELERRHGRRALAPDFSTGSERRGLAAPARRTVVIRGQVADRYTRKRSSGPLRVSRSYGLRMRPDRAALWAVLLGFALVVAALASAHM